jgi:hypothetical protein
MSRPTKTDSIAGFNSGSHARGTPRVLEANGVVMSKFYLATVAAVAVTASLASNILVVGPHGPAHPGLSARARMLARRWLRRFKHLVDTWVAAMIARRERQAALYPVHSMIDGELGDIGLSRASIDQIEGYCAPRPRRTSARPRR